MPAARAECYQPTLRPQGSVIKGGAGVGCGLGAGNDSDEGLPRTRWSWMALGRAACGRQGQIWGRCVPA